MFSVFGNFHDKRFAKKIKRLKKVNSFQTIVIFCHYPVNCILTTQNSIFEATAFLCGHLHSKLGTDKTENKIVCKQRVLEDFEENRKFRIFTIFNDEFNYNDFKADRSPKIVILGFDGSKIYFLKYFVDDVEIFVDEKQVWCEIKEKNKLFEFEVFEEFKKVKIVGKNELGSSFHEFSKNERMSSFRLDLNYKFVFFVINVLYLIILFALFTSKGFKFCGTCYVLKHVLPTALLRPFTKKWMFLSIYGIGFETSFDMIYYYAITLIVFELPLLVYMCSKFKIALIFYDVMVCIIHYLIINHFGFCLTLESFCFLVVNVDCLCNLIIKRGFLDFSI
jgi:hypothetical protein